jgi:hypothetical protein
VSGQALKWCNAVSTIRVLDGSIAVTDEGPRFGVWGFGVKALGSRV